MGNTEPTLRCAEKITETGMDVAYIGDLENMSFVYVTFRSRFGHLPVRLWQRL